MHATSFNKPQTQRLALLNAQFDLSEIARRSEISPATSSSGLFRTIFPSAKDAVDYCIYEGDILFTPVETGRKRRRGHEAHGQGQQPNVLSSLNGMYVSTTAYASALEKCGGDKKRANRELFKQQYEVVGISLKNQIYESYKKTPLDNPVAIIGGVFHMPNLGKKTIRPMDIVVWDVPDDDTEMPADTTKFMPHTPSMRKLITEPLELTTILSVDKMIEIFKGNAGNGELSEGKLMEQIIAVAELMKPMIGLSGDDRQNHIEAHKKDFKEGFQSVIDAVVKSMEEAKTRIIGRCLRGAQPGERMDILVLR